MPPVGEEIHSRRIVPNLPIEERRKTAENGYTDLITVKKMSAKDAARQVFENYARHKDEEVASEYLDRFLKSSKPDESAGYEMFLDFTKGRKGIKSNIYAAKVAPFLTGTRDADKLLALTAFFEENNNREQAYKFYRTLSEIFSKGEGVKKDLKRAADYIKSALEIYNTPDNRKRLREIYEQQSSSGDAYKKMIDDGIDGAKSDYAEHLVDNGKKSEALHWFTVDHNFEAAYQCVNIKSLTEIDRAIKDFKDNAGAETVFSNSLKRMRSKFSTLQKIFNISEVPSSHWGMALQYLIGGPIWAIYRTTKLDSLIYFALGLVGTVALTAIGVFILGANIGVIFCMVALMIWMFVMIGVDVDKRNDFREACRLYDRLAPHDQLRDDILKKRFEKKSESIGEPWGWALILPVLVWLLIAVFVGFVVTHPEIVDDPSISGVGQTIKKDISPKLPTVDDKAEAIKALNTFNDAIKKNDFRRAYACFSEDIQHSLKYEDWLSEVKNSVPTDIFDIKVISEDENIIGLSFVIRAEPEKGKTQDFDATAFMIKSADGWRIASIETMEPQQPEPSKNEQPKVEEPKAEKPKVEEPKPAPVQDDKAQAIAVLNEFHESITKKDYRRAYDCFSDAFKNRVPYDGWAPGFKTTVSSSALDIKVSDMSDDSITLNYNLRAVDDPGGTRNFNSNVVMIKTADGWKINATSNKLK